MRRVALLLVAVLLFGACAVDSDEVIDVIPTPPESTAPAIVVPSGPARTDAFGLVYSATATLNPLAGTNKFNRELAPLLYEGLFRLNAEFKAEAVLCESFSHDGLLWTFNLAGDVLFSDGEPLRAADVVYSLNIARASEAYAARFKYIDFIVAQGELAVNITTARPMGRIELLLDIPIIRNGSTAQKVPPGTGAYTFVDDGSSCYLRIADAHRAGARITRIELFDLPEPELLISAFEMGTVSAVSNDITAADPIIFGGDYEEWLYATTYMYYVGFNTTKPVFMNAEMRRVVAYALDRATMCRIDLLTRAQAFSFDEDWQPDVAELLASFGYEDTDEDGILDYAAGRSRLPLEIKLLVCSDNAFKTAVARRIAENLRMYGIDVSVSEVGWTAYNTALKNGGYDIYIGETCLTPDFLLDELVGTGGALNYSGYSSETVDTLLAEAAAADGDEYEDARMRLYDELAREAPIAPLLFREKSLAARRGVTSNPQPTQYNVFSDLETW